MTKHKHTVAYKGYADVAKRFDIEPSPGRERHRFYYIDKSHDTFNAGELVPFMWFPVLPGDDLTFSPRMLVRLSNALISPLMDEIIVSYYFFLSYNRFVFDEWNQFMGEFNPQNSDYDESGDNFGGQSITEPPYNTPGEFELPTLVFPGSTSDTPNFPIGSLFDHLGLPYNVGNSGYEIQSLLPRHYNHIWNEYFRDENLQQMAPVPRSIGPDKISQFKVLPVLKYRDYFTGSLPFLQKGPNVSIGLTGDIPVYWSSAQSISDPSHTGYMVWYDANGAAVNHANGALSLAVANDGSSTLTTNQEGGPYRPISPYGFTRLSNANAVTIAQLRMAFQLQRFYEGQARSGTRYIEYVHFMFNEFIPDVQLLRPKFIGGGKFFINVNPVTQTSSDNSQPSPLGTLAAFGVAYNRDDFRASCHCNEHGYVIGLLCVRTNLSYQQGLDRDFSKRDRFDFYTSTLAHVAEQSVLNKELCCTGIPAYDNGVFGYIGRYDEYRTCIPRIKGYFRSNAPLTLNSYHLGEYFDTSNPGDESNNFSGLPHLNSNFIVQPSNVINRSMNLPAGGPANIPQFLADFATEIRGSRVVSKYGIPGYADHF